MPQWVTEWMPAADLAVKAIIAAVGASLAYQTWRVAVRQADTASDKLKLDLYDRRFAVYEATERMINAVLGPDPLAVEVFEAASNELNRAWFLFGPDVCDWLVETRVKARALNSARLMLGTLAAPPACPPARYAELTGHIAELTAAMNARLIGAGTFFGRYLDFAGALGASPAAPWVRSPR